MSNGKWQEHVLTGHLAPEEAGQYYNVPFDMPAGVTRLEVSYEYSDQIGADVHLTGGNTLDIGLFDSRGVAFPGAGFRGWSGSARREFFVELHEATPGYLPGPLDAGTWYIILGFYKSASQGCDYRITIRYLIGEELDSPPAFPPMLTLENSTSTLQARGDGWYCGELHCHTYHSDGDSSPHDLVKTAAALGLDFLAITDHNAISHLVELAALVPSEIVLIPGCEVTTYKGHWNVWGLDKWIDFRTLSPELMAESIRQAVGQGYLTSCNHPKTAGPPWAFKGVTGQHCVEVWNGPWQVFNAEALAYWESRLRAGERLVAVGGSDTHFLKQEHIARIGTPTNWVHCAEPPSAKALLDGLRAGHAFVSDAPDGPQLYLRCGEAMMGDAIVRPESGSATFEIRVVNGQGLIVELHGSHGMIMTADVLESNSTLHIDVPLLSTLYVRAQLVEPGQEPVILKALTNPIYIEKEV